MKAPCLAPQENYDDISPSLSSVTKVSSNPLCPRRPKLPWCPELATSPGALWRPADILKASLLESLPGSRVLLGNRGPNKQKKICSTEPSKGSFQKRNCGFCPLRGGGYPPCPLSFFEHNDCPLRGGRGYPPILLRKKSAKKRLFLA